MNKQNTLYIITLLLLSFFITTCSGGIAAELPEITATPTNQAPTETYTPEPTIAPTKTPNRAATRSAERTATAIAKATEKQAAFENNALEILDEYEVAVSGSLSETFPLPLSLDTTDYWYVTYNPMSEKRYKNFAFYTKIRWFSTSGLAGCGIAFQAKPEIGKGENYQFTTLRLSGAPAWNLEFIKNNFIEFSAVGGPQYNNIIDETNGGENAYLLTFKDGLFTVYANGEKLRSVDLPKGPGEGLIYPFTYQESGKTTCTFLDSWVWDLDE